MGSKKSRMSEGKTGKEIKRKKQKPSFQGKVSAALGSVDAPPVKGHVGSKKWAMSSDERKVLKEARKKFGAISTEAMGKKAVAWSNDRLRAIGSEGRLKLEEVAYFLGLAKRKSPIVRPRGGRTGDYSYPGGSSDKMLKDIGRMEKANDRKNKKK